MSLIIKRIPLKNFNLEKLQETLDNSFCELVYTDALFEILRKASNENIFVYECIGADDRIEDKINFLKKNSEKYVGYIPYAMEYSYECTDCYEEYLEDEYFEEDEDGDIEYTGCIEIITGGRMHSSESEKFGEAKGCDIGVVIEIDGDDLIFKRAYNGSFNIYQGGAVTVNNLGEYDTKVIEFIESFII